MDSCPRSDCSPRPYDAANPWNSWTCRCSRILTDRSSFQNPWRPRPPKYLSYRQLLDSDRILIPAWINSRLECYHFHLLRRRFWPMEWPGRCPANDSSSACAVVRRGLLCPLRPLWWPWSSAKPSCATCAAWSLQCTTSTGASFWYRPRPETTDLPKARTSW